MNRKSEFVSGARKTRPVWETDGNRLWVETQKRKELYRNPRLPAHIASFEEDGTDTDFLKVADFIISFPAGKTLHSFCGVLESVIGRMISNNAQIPPFFVHILTYGTDMNRKKHRFVLSWYKSFEEDSGAKDIAFLLSFVLKEEFPKAIIERVSSEEKEEEDDEC